MDRASSTDRAAAHSVACSTEQLVRSEAAWALTLTLTLPPTRTPTLTLSLTRTLTLTLSLTLALTLSLTLSLSLTLPSGCASKRPACRPTASTQGAAPPKRPRCPHLIVAPSSSAALPWLP